MAWCYPAVFILDSRDRRAMLLRLIDRLRHWLLYRPERRYMRGRKGVTNS